MTDLLIAPTRWRRLAAAVALLVGLALVIVAGSASPSHAAEDVRLTQPGSGARVEGATPVRVEVDARPLGEVQWVEARLRHNGEIVGSAARLSHEGGERSGGTSTWVAQWDPASGWINGGQALANGAYHIEARAHSEIGLGEGETTEWSGHSVTVSQPAATPQLQAELRDDGQVVALQWSEAAASDFVRYELERAPDGGAFETVARISQRGEAAYRDEPPAPGAWHYRVTTVRGDGAGGEVSATSGTATVETVDPDEESDEDSGGDSDEDDEPSSTPDDDNESDDNESDDDGLTPTPDEDGDADRGDGDGGAGDGEDGDDVSADDGDSGQTGQGQGGDDGSSTGTSGQPGLREGEEPPPSSGESSVPQLDGEEAEAQGAEAQDPVAGDPADDSFSRELPYEDPEVEREDERDNRSEAEIAQADPPQSRGMITVGDQELALERALPPMAGGLLLVVTAGHILRLRQRLS